MFPCSMMVGWKPTLIHWKMLTYQTSLKGQVYVFPFSPLTSIPAVIYCLAAWMALSMEQMEQFFPISS